MQPDYSQTCWYNVVTNSKKTCTAIEVCTCIIEVFVVGPYGVCYLKVPIT